MGDGERVRKWRTLVCLDLRIVAEPLLRLFLSALEILSINGLNELTSVIPYLLTSEE